MQLAEDFEHVFGETRHADFRIICEDEREEKSRELLVHKIILSARSPVFAAMLEPHTEEAQKNEVHFNDIDYDVFFYKYFWINI